MNEAEEKASIAPEMRLYDPDRHGCT